jgi:peptidoglycan/xylan/chitin deacetylase (PgdA/CDA1 family)
VGFAAVAAVWMLGAPAWAQDAAAAAAAPAPAEATCPADPSVPAVTPTVEIDTRPEGPSRARYGSLQYDRTPIGARTVALTIDDGPDAANTLRVLDILDAACVKATFFFVGRYAAAYPELVREVARRGHTIGTHSRTHPNNLRRLSVDAARAQIRGGFEAADAALAASPPEERARLLPFFRFPGLNDTPGLLAWLGERRIATFSSEAGVDDWRGISAAEIRRRGLKYLNQTDGGVVIIHETKPNLVEALPDLIRDLRAAGYSFVQLTASPEARAAAASAPDALIRPLP